MGLTTTQSQIVQQLQRDRVAKWTGLAEQIECSTKTVQRTLVTLKDVPRFDQRGLWTYETVHFSEHGNLPQTLRRIVEQAPAGCTVQELEQLVGTRVHNHVSRLLREGKLDRFFQGRKVVYLAADPRRRLRGDFGAACNDPRRADRRRIVWRRVARRS